MAIVVIIVACCGDNFCPDCLVLCCELFCPDCLRCLMEYAYEDQPHEPFMSPTTTSQQMQHPPPAAYEGMDEGIQMSVFS